ncbi:MAG: hypothetical protein R3B06_14860 [Kofleriaceae bacterium]
MNNNLAFLSCRATLEHGLENAPSFTKALIHAGSALAITPGRILLGKKALLYSDERLRSHLYDVTSQKVSLWNSTEEGPRMRAYLRDGGLPGAADYTDRATCLVLDVDVTKQLFRLLDATHRHFGVVSAAIAGHATYSYAEKEAFREGVAGAWDAATEARIQWDAMNWWKARTKLIRLSPITIIGPSIWAQLPPMPRFDPMPTVEDLGACKLLRAWPSLCEPRDPAFLRGTRALRAWLWPYTIQNPADHIDNDPP